jgi:two-component system KDP operon response regulator KdpE
MKTTKILVIEDDKPTLAALKMALKARGHEVVVAVDGIGGVTVAANEKPDLVITDIGLPCGDGLAVMARIHNLLQSMDVPFIVLTGRTHPECEKQAMAAGASAFYRKPADLDAMCAKVAWLLSPYRAHEAAACQVPL